jgi:hypothetical protein
MIGNVNDLQFYSWPTDTFSPHTDEREHTHKAVLPESVDTVEISSQGRDLQQRAQGGAAGLPGEEELDVEQQREVDQLKQTDQEVKSHESAHMAAGAGLVVGGASYQYQRGPDGKMYAVGGEVKIDTSREKDPEDTIRKMQQVKMAALAPSQPSGQDRSVAARASQIEAEARIELTKKKAEEAKQQKSKDDTSTDTIPGTHQNAYNPPKSDSILSIVA